MKAGTKQTLIPIIKIISLTNPYAKQTSRSIYRYYYWWHLPPKLI